ncbi:MAG TPA: ornithine carbamoyltransferase [Candidatus Limnocylindria bacterium]|nr:ornithine carbamoyltransferase [Candidatus Limnocylindria bacterium]
MTAKRDFLRLLDLETAELETVLALAGRLKRELRAGTSHALLPGRTLAMIFEKPSLRTRVTFEVGMVQLGGAAIHLAPGDIRLGEREPASDIARNLERWCDVIMARVFLHRHVEELASAARVPVVNGLSDMHHPCQVLADCFTLLERFGRLDNLKVAFIGDGNNMVHSWIDAAARFGFELAVACPQGYEPDPEVVAVGGSRVTISHDVAATAADADVLYTDVWTSMGQEAESVARRRAFRGYQINDAVVRRAKPTALVMHCLPAHRGEEITAEVIDGPQSIVFDQAENRLHAQKAVLLWLLGAVPAA